ncbi:MAG: metallopeptidase TldD-related protein [Myxococcota bacterium]
MIACWMAFAAFADPMVDGLKAEVDRAMRDLDLPNAPRPYHIGLRMSDIQSVRMSAAYGGLLRREVSPSRRLSAEVRVGDADHDNSNFDVFQDGWNSRRTVLGSDPLALRHDAWLLVDESYKDAIEALAAKDAALQRRALGAKVPDFAPGPAQTAFLPLPTEPDPQAIEASIRSASKRFLDHPQIEASKVYVRAAQGREIVVDSGGTTVVRPVDRVGVRVAARVRADDGASMVDQAVFVTRGDEVPDEKALAEATDALVERLEAWRAAPVAQEAYVGPVLFEADAAVALVRRLLVPALTGTPPKDKPPRGSRVAVFGKAEGESAMSAKRRVLPAGWFVDDDPMRDPTSPAAYAFDSEGEPARKVELVRNGIVQSHLMTRTPRLSQIQSTGHARGKTGTMLRAMPANLEVRAPKQRSERKLRRQALRLAADYGLDYYVVIRRIQDPAVEELGLGPSLNFAILLGMAKAEALPGPVVAVKVYADGREELVRGWAFGDFDRGLFRDVAAAGAQVERTLLLPSPGESAAPASGYAVAISTPSLLIDEVELSLDSRNVEKPPRIANPLAANHQPEASGPP